MSEPRRDYPRHYKLYYYPPQINSSRPKNKTGKFRGKHAKKQKIQGQRNPRSNWRQNIRSIGSKFRQHLFHEDLENSFALFYSSSARGGMTFDFRNSHFRKFFNSSYAEARKQGISLDLQDLIEEEVNVEILRRAFEDYKANRTPESLKRMIVLEVSLVVKRKVPEQEEFYQLLNNDLLNYYRKLNERYSATSFLQTSVNHILQENS